MIYCPMCLDENLEVEMHEDMCEVGGHPDESMADWVDGRAEKCLVCPDCDYSVLEPDFDLLIN